MKPRIAVVDDNRDLARGVGLVLGELSDQIAVYYSAEEALEALSREPADIIFSDIKMPGMDGVQFLGQVLERWPAARVVLFTAHATVESAVSAMKQGAFDYLTKPFDNDDLLQLANRAWQAISEENGLSAVNERLTADDSFHGIVTRDRRMLPVLDTIRRAAATHATVLIYGESGTGKELVARALHAESNRRDGPFVAFNAAALPESLAEAELFGAKRGAYTSADRDRQGLFEEAHGGTLFIDEVSSMPPTLQGKLLRAIQEKEIRPLGTSKTVRVDARIVAATNEEPQRLLDEGRIRKDLYYRLAVVRIAIPPLRERPDDISVLASLFLERLAEETGDDARRLSARAAQLLANHDWPGNVRELQNVIERAAVMSSDEMIGPSDIHLGEEELAWQFEGNEPLGYDEAKRAALERFQRRYVERLLAETGGNMSASARRAGITRAALHRIVKRLGIEAQDSSDR